MTVHLQRQGQLLVLSIREPAQKDDCDRYITALETISGADAPFLLLVDVERELSLSQHHRKAQNLWYKATRERLDRACTAAAIIRLQPTETAQRTFQALWRFPLLVTSDKSEAETFLARHGNAP